jgi:membrane peptidoglycan carboxypeptidase
MAIDLGSRQDEHAPPAARRGGGRSGRSRRGRRPGHGGPVGGRRRRRWVLRLTAALAAAVLLAGLAGLLLLAVSPSATSAPAKVQAILADHGAPSDGGSVPPKVATALLATEDSRYRSEMAIDPQGTVRAIYGLLTHNPNEGGATIEVQLAKMLYTPRRSDPAALAEQVALAFKLDHDFGKSRILAMYLDAAYFGDGAYGITQAAHHYFGVPPSALTWAQATLLAGLVQAPSRFDPHGHLAAALARRRQVLHRLVAVGALSSTQAAAIETQPLDPVVPFYG